MAKEVRQSFTRTGGYQVRKKFRFAGKDYEPGAPFPWRRLSCSTRRLRQLYDGRWIDPAGDDLPIEEESQETTADETSAAAADTNNGEEDKGEGDEEESDDGPDKPSSDGPVKLIFDPATHEVTNPLRGKWYITTKDGEIVETIYRSLGLKLKEAVEPVKLTVDADGDLVVLG